MTETMTMPVSYYPQYLLYGAVGGYVGAYAMAKFNQVDNIEPLGRYQVESGIAGAVGNYLWLVIRGPSLVDTDTVWKGMLMGVAAEWLYNRFLKGAVANMWTVA